MPASQAKMILSPKPALALSADVPPAFMLETAACAEARSVTSVVRTMGEAMRNDTAAPASTPSRIMMALP